MRLILSFLLSTFLFVLCNGQCSVEITNYELECHNNGTSINSSDDYIILTIEANGTNASANYRVVVTDPVSGLVIYNSPNTPYGTTVIINGNGLGGNPMLNANGISVYNINVRDQSTGTCRQLFTTIPINSCSPPCTTPNCGDVTVDGVFRSDNSLNSNGFEVEDGYVTSGDGISPPPNSGGSSGGQNWDVAFYNSSRFGVNRGGGSYAPGYNIGAWTQVVAPRTNGYIAKHSYGSVTAYNRLGLSSGFMLGINGTNEPPNTSFAYNYNFGNYDFGNNIPPSSITEGDVIFDTWFCPSSNAFGANGATDNTFHTMKFKDGNGNLMLELGSGNVWFTAASGFPSAAVSLWTRANQDPALINRSATGNGIFANNHGWSQWQVIFHMHASAPDSVTVIFTPAAIDAGLGIVQTYNAPITLLNRVPLIGNLNANFLSDWEITTESGGPKYFYEEGYSSYCPDSEIVSVCDDGADFVSVNAESGMTNVTWQNASNAIIGSGLSISINSNTLGMSDGTESFTYSGIDGNGCYKELCCPVFVTTKTCAGCNLAISCSPISQSSCTPVNGSASTSVTGAQGTLSYLWSSGEVVGSISGKVAGTYTVTVTDNFLPGCTATCQAVITSTVTLPTAMCTPVANSNCATPNGSASVSTNATMPMYLWSNGSASSAITGLNAGTYTVTVTDTSTGCTNTCQAIVTNTTTPPTAMCTPVANSNCATPNGSASVSTNAATPMYLWSNGSASSAITGLNAGTYTVTVTDTNTGCTNTCQTVVNNTTTPPTAMCTPVANSNCATPNGSASVSTNATTPMYLWSNGSAASAITGLNAGTYTVTVTDTSTGCTNTCQAIVTNTTTPPTAMCTPVANSNCATPNGSASVSTNAATPMYLWSNGSASSAITGLNAGTYTVTVTDTNTGCTNTCQAVVTNTTTPPTAMCTPVANNNCATPNGSASVSTNATTPMYLWSNGSAASAITGLNAGTYTVTVTDTSSGCTNTCQAIVTNTTTPPTAMCTPVANNNCATPNGSASVSTNATVPMYLWSNGSAASAITGLNAGTYTVTVTDTSTGCTNTCQAVVANNTVNPSCNVTIGNQPSCANLNGGSVTVTPTPSGTYSYTWSDGGPNIDVRSGLAGGTYTVTVTNTVSGCTGVCQTTLDTPMNCCNINAVAPSDIVCLDNGTPTIITDNRIRFNANITNTNNSLTSYHVTVNGGTTITPNTNIPYGLTTFTLGTGTAGGGATFTITVTDSATPGCTQTFQVTDPGGCNNTTPCPAPKCGTVTIQVNGN